MRLVLQGCSSDNDPNQSSCEAAEASKRSLTEIMDDDFSLESSDSNSDAGDDDLDGSMDDPAIGGADPPAFPVQNVVPDCTQIPLRICLGGYLYKRKNHDKKTGRHYYYCVAKDCKAGFYVDPGFPMTVPNGKLHSHDPAGPNRTLIQNLAEISLRKYVQQHIDDESSRIRAQLLSEIEHGAEGFPAPAAITIKKIQNIKGHIQGTVEGRVLKTCLPLALTEVGGQKLLQWQAVTPPVLILATKASCELLKSCNVLFLCRLKITGPILKNCYCVYGISELESKVWPCIWLLFAHIEDPKTSVVPWVNLKWFLNGITSCAKRWVIPVRQKYIEVIRHMSGRLDSVKGLMLSFKYKIDKILSSIEDTKVSAKLRADLLDFSKLSSKDHQTAMSRISEENPDESVQKALREWTSTFSKLDFLYHHSVCYKNKLLNEIYRMNKHERHAHRTDEAVLKEIQEIYKRIYVNTLIDAHI